MFNFFEFALLLTSFLPYIIISKNFSYLESRYYYLASLSWAMIFTWILTLLSKKFRSRFIKILLAGVFLLLLYVHAKTIIRDVNQLVVDSQLRIQILGQIKALKPNPEGDKNIFYVTGDTDYYVVGNKLPFQNGVGYILMTLYYDSGRVSRQLLSDGFLFEIGSQGYKEVGGKGFGYFYDKHTMERELRKNRISPDSVYIFYFDSKSRRLN